MAGSTELEYLLREARPVLDPENYVFLCLNASYGDHADLRPLACLSEDEGLTLVVPQRLADESGLPYDGVFRKVTLQVHSSLHAVGLTAAISGRLAAENISANVFAGFHHDHLFVPLADAERAMSALSTLAERRLDLEQVSPKRTR